MPKAKFMTGDVKNFYLNTPMDWPEYMKIALELIPDEITIVFSVLPFDYFYVNSNAVERDAVWNDLESLPVKWCRRAHKPRAPQNRRTYRDRTENCVDWTAPADYFDWTEPWMGQNRFT